MINIEVFGAFVMKGLLGFLVLFVTSFFSVISNAASYSYIGHNFTEAYGVYLPSYKVTGNIVTTVPVSPNTGLVDIKNTLVSYSFFDGVQTLDESNSFPLFFAISTTNSNQIEETAITIWRTPITTVNGEIVEGMDVYDGPLFTQVNGFLDAICNKNSGPGGQCSQASSQLTNSGHYIIFDEIFINGFDF